jgi:hypothetical protein
MLAIPRVPKDMATAKQKAAARRLDISSRSKMGKDERRKAIAGASA